MRMSGFNIFTLSSRSADTFKKTVVKINQKISGTFIEKIVNYLRLVYVDYKEVAVQVRSDIRAKPVKAATFFTGMGLLGYSLATNPNERSFKAKFIQCANDLSTVNPQLVNPHAVEHVKMIQLAFNRDLIRHTSLGLFSIIWIDKYSDQCNMYETNCSYLQVPYRKIVNQVIDVGFLNVWWIISRKMLDYDINY